MEGSFVKMSVKVRVSYANGTNYPQALATSKQRREPHLHAILNCTRGIAFLGTPHGGADTARFGGTIAKIMSVWKQSNPRALQALQPESEVLARIQDSFHSILRARDKDNSIEITCFYEELPTKFFGIVSLIEEMKVLPNVIPAGCSL